MTIRRCIICLAGFVAAAAVTLQAQPQTITLNFNSRPSAQGWKYEASGSPNPFSDDKVIFTTDGTTLHQDTIQANKPNANLYQTGGGDNLYRFPNVVEREHPFTITVRVAIRAVASCTVPGGKPCTGVSTCGFTFGANTGTESYGVCLNRDVADANSGGNTVYFMGGPTAPPMAFSNADFHTYQLEVMPGMGAKLYRDCQLVRQGAVTKSTDSNGLYLGDGTGGANAVADVQMYSYKALSASCPLPGSGGR